MPDIALRILTALTFLMVALLAGLPFISPLIDWWTDMAVILGRLNNYAFLVAMGFLFLALLCIPMLRRDPDTRVFLATSLLVLTYAVGLTQMKSPPDHYIYAFGGLLILSGSIAAGVFAHALAARGVRVPLWISGLTVLSLAALPLPPLLIALDPEASDKFWVHVYGYGNVRAFGYSCTALVAVAAGLMTTPGRARPVLVLGAVAAVTGWTFLFWSGSRAGLVALVGGLPLMWLLMRRISRAGLAGVLGTAAAGAALSQVVPRPDDRAFDLVRRLRENMHALFGTDTSSGTPGAGASLETLDQVSSSRLQVWQWSWDKIMDAPLTGHGFHPMSRLRDEVVNLYHAHNIVLEYWLSLGLVAGTAALGMGLWLWGRALWSVRSVTDPARVSVACLISVFAVYALVSGPLFHPYQLLVFAMGVGALLGAARARPMEADDRDAPDSAFVPDATWMMGPEERDSPLHTEPPR